MKRYDVDASPKVVCCSSMPGDGDERLAASVCAIIILTREIIVWLFGAVLRERVCEMFSL